MIARLVEHSLTPEVGDEIAVGLGDGMKGGLGDVAQGRIVAPA